MKRFRSIAWLVLLATLYSAASPTLAAVFLMSSPPALGQMLRIPAAAESSPAADECVGHLDHDSAPTEHSSSSGPPQPAHERHGIYCSLCLNPSSIATIAPAPVVLAVRNLAFHVAGPGPAASFFSSFLPLYRSRAPPVQL